MGMIINIDQALKLRTDYNVLREPLNDMLKNMQEAWEKKNPIDLLFNRGSLSTFQETFTSSIGFDHAFAETGDYQVGPIFNTAEGFSATYRSRTFQGGFVITQQALEDGQHGRIKNDAMQFTRRWHGDLVDYAMKAISAGFGKTVTWGSTANGGVTRLLLTSADTVDGDIANTTKNPLFCKQHTIVKRDGMASGDISAAYQSNIFCVSDGASSPTYGISLTGTDPDKIVKLADVINQVITIMENYKDDNGKRAGVLGAKTIVCGNHAHLKAALNTALNMDMFNNIGKTNGLNPAYKRATVEDSPYLLDISQCANGIGFFIVDKSYNSENHGPEFTERIAFTLDVTETKRPSGINYDGRQRFDINVASWRGIAYVYLGASAPTWSANGAIGDFTPIIPTATVVTPVSVVGTVSTDEVEAAAAGGN